MDILKTAEATLVELEVEYECIMLTDHEKVAQRESPWELRHYRTLSFIDITQERAWDLLHRYYADAAREYSRAFAVFRKLKELRNEPGPPELPTSEPEREPIGETEEEQLPETQQVRNELPAGAAAEAGSKPKPAQRNKSRRLNLGRLVRR
jgi:hypothetical protein